MKSFILAIFISLFCLTSIAQSQQIDRLFRFPNIHGDSVVFTYAGDLYLSSIDGGVAKRLTSHPGFEMFAKISPDGKTIAFTGQYDGNTEVYTMPIEGGVPKRLTYTATLNRDDVSDRMGPNNIVMAWTPDGKHIVFRSRKQTFNSFVGQLFKVSVDGGMAEELPLPRGGFCNYSPDGDQLAYNRVFREFRTWKYYRGGMADDVWIYDFKTKKTINCTNNKAQDIFPMWVNKQVYFISDRDRNMNLFSYNTENKQIIKHTNFSDYDIKFPSIGRDKIIFEKGGYLFVFNTLNQEVSKLNIEIKNDVPWGRDRYVDASKSIKNIALSPKGSRVLLSARGDIYNVPAEKGVTYNLTQSSGAHDREAEFSPDGKYFAWLSDMNGEYDVYMQAVEDGSKPIQLTSGAKNYKFSIQWSPDSKKIMWSDKEMNLKYVNIETKEITKVFQSKTWEIRDFTWSPDSKWIAFSDNDGDGLNKLFVYNTESKEVKALTQGWYSSSSPVFGSQGKFLFFTSDREFNPIYSATEWNAAYRNMGKIFMISLQKEVADPFLPEDINDASKSIKKDKKGEEKVAVAIDFNGIENRIIGLDMEAGNYWNLTPIGNRLYYNFYKFGNRGSAFKMYNLKKNKESNLGKNISFDVSADQKKMLIASHGKIQVINLPQNGPVSIKEPINVSGLKTWVNIHEEWKQIYDEAWRQMRDFFYDPEMQGVDWKAMHDKYAALVPYVNHRNDLTYLIGELIGEINIGHAYINGGERPKVERVKTGLLGAKISRDASGYFKIDKILKGENFRANLRSPLTAVGLKVAEGNYIVGIDGVDASQFNDIYKALYGKANMLVKLQINDKASTDGAWTIIVKTIADESGLYYYNWVEDNIRKVNEATNGEVGYIHIPDMGVAGLNEFMKHFYPQLTKKALIIDDRGNGGGNVSPMIIERLRREITRANLARNQRIPGQTPRQMMVGPKVLLINQYSASDGDLFPYSFKKHQLGKVIGVRSWGGVTGIRGSLPFIDGADLRKPEFGTYAADGSKWIIENHGIDPDIVVINDPAKEYAGEDEQLNRAIKEIKKELKNYKPVPMPPAYPNRTK